MQDGEKAPSLGSLSCTRFGPSLTPRRRGANATAEERLQIEAT
jgi:hypothetical protein